MISGLPYLCWDDFTDIRSALIESHIKGRKPFGENSATCNLNVAIASDIIIPPDTEEVKPILDGSGNRTDNCP